MKKYLILAAAACLVLASCAKVSVAGTEAQNPASKDLPISFEAYKHVAQTKGDPAIFKFYQGGEFNVFAFYSATNWAGLENLEGDARFIDGEGVKLRDAETDITSQAWRTLKHYYWPKVGTLSFFSYYPSSVTATMTDKTKYIEFKDYTVKETLNGQAALVTATATEVRDDKNDILVADPQIDKTYADQTLTYYNIGVPMLFHHKLAKVKLMAKQAPKPEDGGVVSTTFRIIINSINIKDIHCKGDYNTASTAIIWEPKDVLDDVHHTDSDNFVDGMTNDGKGENKGTEANPKYAFDPTYALPLYYVDEKAASPVENDYNNLGNEFYVLPQEIENKSVLEVNYSVFALDDSVDPAIIVSKQDYSAKIQLNQILLSGAEKIHTWKIGNFYTYKLLISPYGAPILFDPAIEDWSYVEAKPEYIYSY